MAYYRSDQFTIHLSATGLPESKTLDNVQWDAAEGGEQTVEGQTYLPGGMRPLVSLGGIPKRQPLTLKRVWSDAVLPVFKSLDKGAGQTPCSVTIQTLNVKREPTGETFTYTGTLGSVTRPNYGHETPEKAYLQVMVDLDGEMK